MVYDDAPEPGRRKDGKPYKDENTREDGSYVLGKGRPPEKHQFRTGDGRKRGKRKKGERNLLTEWREELDASVQLTEGPNKIKVSKRRGIIKTTIDRAMKKSDRAAETALRYAEASEKRAPGLRANDLALIDGWLADQMASGDSDDAPEISDGTKAYQGDGVAGDD